MSSNLCNLTGSTLPHRSTWRYLSAMPLPRSLTKSERDLLDLNLPIPDAPVPTLPTISVESAFLLNEQVWEDAVYDEAYFARSLAAKNDVPFVM